MLLVVAALAACATSCTEVRGRKMIQDANELYRRGKYQDAVALFEQAEKLVPNLPVLWLNKGYTCRQLIIPGAKMTENRPAAECALAAFTRLGALRPGDPRADQLYVQTLFDVDDHAALERLFLERNRRQPDDVDVIRGLQQVYYKQGRWPQALEWSRKAAALRAREAEAQYGMGTFIWQILSSHGGGAEMATFDPRPKPPEEEPAAPVPRRGKKKADIAPALVTPTPPPRAATDITGAQRAELAEEGIQYLLKALALRPRYPEAMTYLSLLHRQKSIAHFDDPAKWQTAVDQGNDWQKKAMALRTATAGKP